MSERHVANEIDAIEAELLIGQQARLSLHPDIMGHIVAVTLFAAGRVYVFSCYGEEGMMELELDGFQLELI